MLRTLVAILTCTLLAPAQETPKPPAAVASLAKMLGKKAGPGAANATRFKPSGKPVLLPEIADALGQDAEQRTALREALVEGAKAVEAELAKAGHPNDVAAGLAFGIATNWQVWKNVEVSDPASEALLAQLQGALDTPEFRALKDRDKQKAYEYGVGLGVFIAVMKESAADDEDTMKGVRTFAGEVLKTLLGADPATLTLTKDGLGAAGKPASRPAGKSKVEQTDDEDAEGEAGKGKKDREPEADAAAGQPFAVATPQGWTKEGDGDFDVLTKTLATINDKKEPLLVRVIVSHGGATGEPEALLHQCYDKLLRPLIPANETPGGVNIKEARPDVCRRLVGNGLRCHFAGVSWSKRDSSFDYFGTSQELHLYLIESGRTWYPVVAQLAGLKGPVDQANGKEVSGGVRHDWLEEVWAGTTGEASKEPILSSAELVGKWELSGSTAGPFYYNANTGASLGMGMVVRNMKIEFRADGSYTSKFVGGSGIGTVRFQSQTIDGKWALKYDKYGVFLAKEKTTIGTGDCLRLGGCYALPDGRRVLIELHADNMPTLPWVWQNGDRYFTMKE